MSMDLSVNEDVARLFETHLDEADGLSPEKTATTSEDRDTEGEEPHAEERRPKLRQVEEETAEEAPEGDQEELDTSAEEGAEAEGEEEGEDFIETWAELAETFEVPPDDLLGHIQIEGRGDDLVPLQQIVSEWREAPNLISRGEAELGELRAEQTKVHDERIEQLQAQTLTLMQRLESENHSEEWWAKLRDDNPGEWIKRNEQRNQDKRSVEEAFATMRSEGERRSKVEAEDHDRYVSEQADLLYKLRPAWKDENAGKAAHADITEILNRSKFSDEQKRNLVDAKSIEIVWKAAQWDKSQDKKPALKKRLRRLPRKHRASSARDERPQVAAADKRYQSSSDKLRETGKFEDGVEAFERFLE